MTESTIIFTLLLSFHIICMCYNVKDKRGDPMKIYNARYLDNNQRFIMAIIAGFISAIILGSIYGIITSAAHIEFSFLNMAIGYGVAYSVRKFGRGVHKRFMVVGAIMTLLAFFIGDCISILSPYSFILAIRYGNFRLFGQVFEYLLRNLLSANIYSVLSFIFRGLGIYIGYSQSVIL